MMDYCCETADLINTKCFKIAKGEESIAYWKKVVGDYYRYAFEACEIVLEIKTSKVMEDIERKAEQNQEGSDYQQRISDNSKSAEQRKLELEMSMSEGIVKPRRWQSVHTLETFRERLRNDTIKCYSLATLKSEKNLTPAHPTRLGINLNFAVFYWDCMEDRDQAMKICNEAMEYGATNLEKLEDDSDLTDASTLLELIKENTDMWEDIIFTEQ